MTPQPCGRCDTDTRAIGEQFMLTHSLWKHLMKAFEFDVRFLCVECVEHLLHQPLNPLDFMLCPLNYDLKWYRSRLLVNRLTTFPDE